MKNYIIKLIDLKTYKIYAYCFETIKEMIDSVGLYENSKDFEIEIEIEEIEEEEKEEYISKNNSIIWIEFLDRISNYLKGE